MRIIALAGRAGSGKDTVAAALPPEYPRLAFGDAVKAAAADLLGVSVAELEARKRDPDSGVREALQGIGEGCRRCDPDVWVRKLAAKLPSDDGVVVITDVRHENELRFVRQHGATVVLVHSTAPRCDHADPHPSETAFDADVAAFLAGGCGATDRRFDAFVLNDYDTVEELHQTVKKLMLCDTI